MSAPLILPTLALSLTATAAGGGALDLAQALRIALAQQPSLRQAEALHRAAEARADGAQAGLWPQVNLSATYQRTTGNFAARPGAVPSSVGASFATSFKSYDYLLFSGTVEQLLYDFGQTSGRWHAAEATARAQQAAVRAARQQLVYEVQSSYFAARAARDLLGVARANLENQERHLQQIEGFVRVGTRPDIDLAQSRTDRANAQLQVIDAENAYAQARAQLGRAMGAPSAAELAEDDFPRLEGEERPLEALLEEAVAARPEVATLTEGLRAQAESVGAARGAYYPTLNLQAQLTDNGPSPSELVPNASVQLVLGWSPFSGFSTRAAVREAEANQEQLDAQLQALRLSIRLEVEQAQLALRGAQAAQLAAAEALANARERQRLAEGRYQAGSGSAIELGDAEVALTQASSQAVSTGYQLATSRAQLARALGR